MFSLIFASVLNFEKFLKDNLLSSIKSKRKKNLPSKILLKILRLLFQFSYYMFVMQAEKKKHLLNFNNHFHCLGASRSYGVNMLHNSKSDRRGDFRCFPSKSYWQSLIFKL